MEFREYRVRVGRVFGAFGGKYVKGSMGDIVLLPPADGDALVAKGIVSLVTLESQPAPTIEIETDPLPTPPVLAPTPPVIDDDMPLVNINTCTVEELEALPHIGMRTARQIIEKRPYASVDEVPGKAGLGGLVKANWYQVAPRIEV